MSSKPCAKCQKPVYPIEELKCLDKTWHKGCFKCHECGMTLNMRNYKGFNKLPYCEAHIPKAKATTVAETPELKRIQENTKNQSNAVYHAEFEKSKGKFTPVVDDPELMRIKQNSKIISNVTYHGDLEKKAIMEQKRILNGPDADANKNGGPPKKSPSHLEQLSSVPAAPPPVQAPQYVPPPAANSYRTSQPNHQQREQQNYHREHEDMNRHYQQQQAHQPTHQQQHQGHHAQQIHQQQQHQQQLHQQQMHQQQMHQQQIQQQMHQQQLHQQQQHLQHHIQQQQQQHSPMAHHPQHQQANNHQGGNPSPYSARGAPNVIYSSQVGGAVNANASRKVGSIADYDPLNNYYGSLDPQRPSQGGRMSGGPPPPQQQQQQQQRAASICYRALYDYEAQDVDEVSFGDGDLIMDCTPVDEGWMTGTVQRTGKRGMLPANYVSSAN